MGTGQRYFLHSLVCQLPFSAARGPGQPPYSRRGDREAADAGAAPTGCSEASTGKTSLGKISLFLELLPVGPACIFLEVFDFILIHLRTFLFPLLREIFSIVCVCFKQDLEQKMKVVENLQDDFDFNYKTLKSQGGK